MRIMDVLLAFPALLLAIAIVAVLGRSLTNAQLAVGIVAIPVYARVMRAAVLSVKEQDFVTAARALGESSRGILAPPGSAPARNSASGARAGRGGSSSECPGFARHRGR